MAAICEHLRDVYRGHLNRQCMDLVRVQVQVLVAQAHIEAYFNHVSIDANEADGGRFFWPLFEDSLGCRWVRMCKR